MLSLPCNAKDTSRCKHDCHITPAQQPVQKVAVTRCQLRPHGSPNPPPPGWAHMKFVCMKNQLTLATYVCGLVQAVMLAGDQVS